MSIINYDQPVRDFRAQLSATGHVTHRTYVKKSVTLHHNAGRLSHEGVMSVWKVRPASAQFDVDGLGRVAQFTEVNEYAWHAGNTQGNIESIGIEMANSTLAPRWEVAEVTWKSACRLAGWLFAKVIKARPTKSNFFYHHHWRATACAGPYMDSVYDRALAEAQRWYAHFTGTSTVKPPVTSNISGSTYTGSKVIDVSEVRPNRRNEAIRRFNGLLWAWLCKNSPSYARANVALWMREPSNYYGLQGQRATQEMYRILNARDPKNFGRVSLPTWPGKDGVRAIGGTPV